MPSAGARVSIFQEDEAMAILATVCAVATAVFSVLFSVWMVKQLFTGN